MALTTYVDEHTKQKSRKTVKRMMARYTVPMFAMIADTKCNLITNFELLKPTQKKCT